jgi:carbon storage regulator
MLVLSRKQKQTILIGDNISVTVLRVHGEKVRLGIEAPRGVRILRSELRAFDDSPSTAAPGARPTVADDVAVEPEAAGEFTESAESPDLPELANWARRGPSAGLPPLDYWTHCPAEVV